MGKLGFVERWFPTYTQYPESRLFSLDILRGLDMILLTVIGPLVRAAQKSWKCFPASMMDQMQHNWTGFTSGIFLRRTWGSSGMVGKALPYGTSSCRYSSSCAARRFRSRLAGG